MNRDTVVLGLGNPLMSDEGIGVRLLDRLAASADKYPSVDFVDGGTGGLSMLYHLEGRHKVVIVDCAYMGADPGEIRKFRPDQARSIKKLASQSLHEQDVLKIISLARELGQCPEQVVIFGIQPQNTALGHELSSRLADRMNHYIALICDELKG